MKITLTQDDGSAVDVTEHVQVLYDLVIGSMDWGSGFIDAEEGEHIYRIADAAGFQKSCFACHYPEKPFEPEPTCHKFQQYGGHCVACSDWYAEALAETNPGSYFRNKYGTHDGLCPQKVAS